MSPYRPSIHATACMWKSTIPKPTKVGERRRTMPLSIWKKQRQVAVLCWNWVVGTGRLVVPLLETGLEIHGLDASAAMLEVAKHKRSQFPSETAKRLHLHLGDMAQFDLGQKFALIYIAFRSFQILLTPEVQRRCLLCIRDHLALNGKVIINLFDPRYDMILPGRQESTLPPREFIHPVSNNHVVVETLERIADPLSQTFQERWRFTETDSTGAVVRQEEEHLQLRWTFRYEMQHLVESCGLCH